MPDRRKLVAALLAGGILSTIVYAVADVLASLRWESYRLVDRSVSELMAVGSPTRDFIVPFMTTYNLLVIGFGVGVWMAGRGRRSVRATGALLLAYGAVSVMGLVVFPLRPDSGITDAGMGFSGVLHSVATATLVLLMFAFMGTGSGAGGRAFRSYSIVSIVVVLGCGALAGSQVQRVASGEIIAGLGLLERASIYGSMVWVAALAVVLLRGLREQAPMPSGSTDASRVTKKVVALVGSGHKGGATHTAAREILDNLEAFGDVEGEIVLLGDHDIRTCRGCKACFNIGKERCPLKDDRDVVFGKMLDADGVIFASPNYSWHVSGLMKVFLDRIGFVFHRPRFHGRTATAVIVQGIAFGGRARKYLEFCAGGLGFKVVKGSVIRTLEPMTEKAVNQMHVALAEQSRRFHDELLRPAFPNPSLLQLAVFRMGRTGIKLNAPRELHDWAYYRDKGWYESDYFYPVRLGPIKKAAGALFDWIGSRMSTFEVAQSEGVDKTVPRSGAPSAR